MPRSPRSEAAARFSAFQPQEKEEGSGAAAITGGSAIIGALLGTLAGVGPIEGAKLGLSIGGPLAGFAAGPQQAAAQTQLLGGGLSGLQNILARFKEQQQAGGFQPSTAEEARLLKDLK